MRRVPILIAALCSLAFVAQHSVARDDETKDKGKEWKEGSVWESILKVKWSGGQESSYAQIIEITKRDGKSFKGQQSGVVDNPVVLEFEGEVDASGMLTITFTKILKASDEWRNGTGRNIIGLKSRGKVDGKSATLKCVHPDPDHPKGTPSISTAKLKLKEMD